MQGKTDWQVRTVFATINHIGDPKHTAKADAREAGAKTWHEVGKEIGIYSYSTYDDYRAAAVQCACWIKGEFGIKDITRIQGEHVASWLAEKVDSGVSRATFDTYASAMEKFEQAIYCFSAEKSGDISAREAWDLSLVRRYGAVELGQRNETSRAYQNPQALVDNMSGKYQLLGQVQRESGTRIDEISRVHSGMLLGVKPDPQSGELKGWIVVSGKGGYIREVGMTPETYSKLEKAVHNAEVHGKVYRTNENLYRANMKAAAEKSGQLYEGSHGLRWSWAQSRHQELQDMGKSYEASLSIVSQEMGHHRSDITTHYLH